ncbi:MAG: hypothetical protein MJE63_11495 [Proteobacteria bacterium]|nr:hypothetical protein [Pseudomonadota bacterium]
MSYVYLFDLKNKIDQKLEKAIRLLSDEKEVKLNQQFKKGQIDMLKEFKKYLSEQYDHKLPKAVVRKIARQKEGEYL